jgi:hypothetical protein
MTALGHFIGALLAAGAVAVGAVPSAPSDRSAPPSAIVVDAAAARDGRTLVDPRLRDVSADVRLPRTADEARTDVRYFGAQAYRIIVAGPRSTAAAHATGVTARETRDVAGAVAALRR